MRITNRQRIEQFDDVSARCLKYDLAVNDLLNQRFVGSISLNPKDEINPRWVGGYYRVRMSPRHMPLFLVTYICHGQDHQTEVWTESEIQDKYRENPTGEYNHILMMSRNRLMEAWRQSEIASTLDEARA